MWNREFEELVERVRTNDPGLKEVVLGYRCVLDGELERLSKALMFNSVVTELSLAGNKLGPTGAKALGNALCHNSTLATLNLQNNNIGRDGGVKFADMLRHNNSLTDLYLSHNDIGPNGAEAIGDALCDNSTLKAIDLGGNNIGTGGVIKLLEMLQQNPSLTYLNLRGEQISEKGFNAFRSALSQNCSLKHLYFDKVGLKEALIHEIEWILEKNKSSQYKTQDISRQHATKFDPQKPLSVRELMSKGFLPNKVGGFKVPVMHMEDSVVLAVVPSTSDLRKWLCSVDKKWQVGGRIESYAPAFEREFSSLEVLSMVAHKERYGTKRIFDACGVTNLGDQALLDNDILKLPSLPHPGHGFH